MAFRFGIVKIIISIACLIVLVQLIVVHRFSTIYPEDYRIRRKIYEESDYFKLEEENDILSHITDWAPKKILTDSLSPTSISPSFTCKIKHKDALSALKRAKSEKCKNEIYRTACLNEADTLYWKNITRLCPVDRSLGRPSHQIAVKPGYGPPIRVLYAMVVHGRAFRQIKRLFKAIFHTNHYFYFHVDSRSDYLHHQVQNFAAQFDNVLVAPWRMATIWGGASLLKMLLRMMEDVLKLHNWKWDFFINLSASDYPVQTDETLSSFLRSHRDENFLKPHGGSVERFVKKQGVGRTFYECDEHMWRLGERRLPDTIDFDGGSDWIALNRKFVHYVINSRDSLVLGLKHLYGYALLPAESFFHSVLRNSPYCETYAKGNLRLTNWKRKLGCRCQYKHIVDWCGCSPNNFKPEDLVRLQSQQINHFARKFEPIVNQEIVNMLDYWLYGKLPNDTPGVNNYWENFYHSKDDNIEKVDVSITFLQSFGRIASKALSSNSDCQFTPIWKAREATYLMTEDMLEGVLTVFDVKVATDDVRREFIKMETHFKPKPMMSLMATNMSAPANRLTGLSIGTIWDQKERIFRNIGGFIGPRDDPTLVHRWVHGEEFHVRIVWQDPLNVIAGMYQMKVEKNWVISFHKPTFNKPLRPGTWTVKIIYNDNVVLGQVRFLVIPLAYVNGKEVSLEDVVTNNNGPPAGLYSNDFVIEFDRDASDTKERVKDFSGNSSSVGAQLWQWIDHHVLHHWDLKATCAITDKKFRKCGGVQFCYETDWSSRSPDPKSEIGNIQENGRIR